MTTTMQYKIIQFFAKDIFFNKCSTCRGLITPVQVESYSEGVYYCEKCVKHIETFDHNYSMSMILLDIDTGDIESVTLYDKVAEDFVGCPPAFLVKLYNQNPDYWQKLESFTIGQYVEAKLQDKNKKDVRKVLSMKLLLQNNPTLYEIIANYTKKGLRYDPSLI